MINFDNDIKFPTPLNKLKRQLKHAGFFRKQAAHRLKTHSRQCLVLFVTGKFVLHKFILQYIHHGTQAEKKFSEVNLFIQSFAAFKAIFFNRSTLFGGPWPHCPWICQCKSVVWSIQCELFDQLTRPFIKVTHFFETQPSKWGIEIETKIQYKNENDRQFR